VPAAIEFQQQHDWKSVRARCHELARETRARIADLTNLEPISPDSPEWFAQMVTCHIPIDDPIAVKARMYDEFKVEAPLVTWQDKQMIRVSYQGYNNHDDLKRLMLALDGVIVS
jgi:isopenicillin-N epimerase